MGYRVHQARLLRHPTLLQVLKEQLLKNLLNNKQQVIVQGKKLLLQKHILKVNTQKLSLKSEREKKHGIN